MPHLLEQEVVESNDYIYILFFTLAPTENTKFSILKFFMEWYQPGLSNNIHPDT